MAHTNEKAVAGGSDTAQDTAHAADNTKSLDFVTVLATYGPSLTKIYRSDGKTDAYDDAASFQCKEIAVTDLSGLSRLLTKLESRTQNCIIRGKYVGDDRAEPGKLEGSIARTNSNFDDCPHHWFMVDIDKYEPDFDDPVNDPVNAIRDYLDRLMPPCFKDVSFHWQLSSSAGMPGKTHILKAHVWFWSETPYTSAQMYAWAKQVGIWIDKAVYRRVQIHYTANPVFEAGRDDPVPVRSGFYQGARDTVALRIAADVLESARQTGSGVGGADMKLVDPSEKDSLVGLFHRTFDAHTVLMEHLEGMFEPGVNDRRWTWLDGGGTPEGVWVHSDGMHVGATHNTWPIDGIVNLWDLVRIFKFGNLDQVEDDFEQLDMDLAPIQGKQSHLAMVEWVEHLPAIKDHAKQEQISRMEGLLARIAAAGDSFDLERDVAPEIQREPYLSATEREQLAVALQSRMKSLTKVNLPIKEARRLVAPPQQQKMSDDAPAWAKDFCWVVETNDFVNINTKMHFAERSYNAKFDRKMGPYADEEGNTPGASDYALRLWNTPIVDREEYAPGVGVFFQRDGLEVLNTYRPELLPAMPAKFDYASRQAIENLEEHTEILVPDERERRLFLDYLAYCVQNPGAKVRWAPLLKGVEGDGKSAFVVLMGCLLGSKNIRILDSATLEKSDFSSWAAGQCFTGVEEVKLHGHNKYDIYNKLKPYISNDCIEVHRKGKDPYNVPNTTNYLLLSNFDDAVPVTGNDRRVMFIRSPFNTKEELFKVIKERTDMTDTEYFDRLFDQAIKKHPGALRKWLMERRLSDEFSANGRAPITSAREMVVDLSVRDDESAIKSLLDEGGLGIYPNLVSVTCLNKALAEQHGVKLNTGRAKAVLTALGFQPFTTAEKNQTKWKGKNHPFYYRGTKPLHPGQEADRQETERQEALVEEAFSD